MPPAADPAGVAAPAPETGLVVVVEEARAAVDDLRADLDAGAGLGAPPHVTVLYPFLPPDRIDEAVLDRLRGLFAGTAAFDAEFADTGWFGDRVLWLAPEPAGAFADLTTRLAAAFPECPPYGGRYADVVPHLTVGDLQADPGPERLPALRDAEAAVRLRLPVRTRVGEVALLVQETPGGCYRRRAGFALGPGVAGLSPSR